MKRFLKDNSSTIVCVVIALIILWFIFGCQSTVRSLTDPTKKVSRPELTLELESELERLEYLARKLDAQAQAKFHALDSQDKLKELLTQQIFIYTSTGGVNPLGVATSLMSILGVGAVTDNVRLRKKIVGSNKKTKP